MIAKILSSSSTFSAVRYNTNKMNKGDGELMLIKNMPFNKEDNISPEEIKTYFKAFSSGHKTENKQFHATISCKEKEMTKEELTMAAEKYMAKMGYGNQPYLVVFHNDTDNNHVHIVSTRVQSNNKLIPSNFEKYKSLKAIRQIEKELSLDQNNKEKLDNLLKYTLSTKNNFKVLLERNGFKVVEKPNSFVVYENGKQIKDIEHKNLLLSNQEHINKKQLRAIFRRYSNTLSSDVVPIREKLAGGREGKITGYESELSNFLRAKFGYDVVYHFKDDKPPFGYTLIDNKSKAVLKGSEVYKLQMNLSKEQNLTMHKLKDYNINSEAHRRVLSKYFNLPIEEIQKNDNVPNKEEKQLAKDLLQTHLENNDISTIKELGFVMIKDEDKYFIVDLNMKNIYSMDELLSHNYVNAINEVLPSIMDDVDDEKIYGKRKKKRRL